MFFVCLNAMKKKFNEQVTQQQIQYLWDTINLNRHDDECMKFIDAAFSWFELKRWDTITCFYSANDIKYSRWQR